MSEEEKIALHTDLMNSMKRSTKRMLERKAKLGERVIVADADGLPLEISAEEALRRFELND